MYIAVGMRLDADVPDVMSTLGVFQIQVQDVKVTDDIPAVYRHVIGIDPS